MYVGGVQLFRLSMMRVPAPMFTLSSYPLLDIHFHNSFLYMSSNQPDVAGTMLIILSSSTKISIWHRLN
jgi:hypothetical protein